MVNLGRRHGVSGIPRVVQITQLMEEIQIWRGVRGGSAPPRKRWSRLHGLPRCVPAISMARSLGGGQGRNQFLQCGSFHRSTQGRGLAKSGRRSSCICTQPCMWLDLFIASAIQTRTRRAPGRGGGTHHGRGVLFKANCIVKFEIPVQNEAKTIVFGGLICLIAGPWHKLGSGWAGAHGALGPRRGGINAVDKAHSVP